MFDSLDIYVFVKDVSEQGNFINILHKSRGDRSRIVGSFSEFNGNFLVAKIGVYDPIKKRVLLGREFDNSYLTHREVEIYYHTLLGKSATQIASLLSRSHRTIEFHLAAIKAKLKCTSHGEIIATAVTTGLTYTLFNAMAFVQKTESQLRLTL